MSKLQKYSLIAILTGPIVLWGLSLLLIISLSKAAGCTVHEGFANPCIVFGVDLGEPLYTLGLFTAWGPLFLPFIWAPLLSIWAVYTCAKWLLRKRKS